MLARRFTVRLHQLHRQIHACLREIRERIEELEQLAQRRRLEESGTGLEEDA